MPSRSRSLPGVFRSVPPLRTAGATAIAVAMVGASAHAFGGLAADPLPVVPALVETARYGDDLTRVTFAADGLDLDVLRGVPGVSDVVAAGPDLVAVTATISSDELQTIVGRTPTPDPPFSLASTEVPLDDPFASYQWALHNTGQRINGFTGTVDADTDALAAFAAGIDGDGVVVAVIDTGVDISHPDLAHSTWVNTDEICANGVDDDNNGFVDDCQGWDFESRDADPHVRVGANGHGTAIASIIAASHDNFGIAGIAPATKIMDLKVGSGGTMKGSDLVAAMYYAVDNGADIINASWGTYEPAPAQQAAVDYAEAHGVLVVAGAGNNSRNNDTDRFVPASFSNANIVSVAATDAADQRSGWSNFGAQTVTLAAPGALIATAMPGNSFALQNGTSFAAPHVAATAALMLSADASLTPSQVKSTLISSVDTLGSLRSLVVSQGRLNIAAALGLDDPDIDGVELPPQVTPPTEPDITVSGLGGASESDPISATVTYRPPQVAPEGPYFLEGTLIALTPAPAVVVGHTIESGGVPLVTNAAGAWTLHDTTDAASWPEQSDISFATALPAGRYALAVQLVDATDPLTLFAQPQVVVFDVARSGATSTTTAASGLTTTTSAGSSTTVASPNSPTTTSGGLDSGPTTTPITAPPATSPSTPMTGPVTTNPGGITPTTIGSGGGSATTSAPLTSPAVTTPPPAPPIAPATTRVIVAPGNGSSSTTTTTPRFQPSPTTRPAATTTAPPVTTPQAPPVSSGDWTITAITPNVCRVDERCFVTIHGTFPFTPSVRVGNGVVPAASVVRSPSMLRLQVPVHANPGTYDVTLIAPGLSLRSQGAFTFYRTTTPPSGPITPETPTTWSAQTTTTAPPATAAPTTAASGPQTPAVPATTTIPPTSRRSRLPLTTGGAFPRNGITIALISGGNPLGNVPADQLVCRATTCRARRT